MFSVCIQFHSTENPGDKIHKSSQPAAPPPHSDGKRKRKSGKKRKRGKRKRKGAYVHVYEERKLKITDERRRKIRQKLYFEPH